MNDVIAYLVPILRQRKVKAAEIGQVLAKYGFSNTWHAIANCIETLTWNYPLYECDESGFYKILTEDDLESYRKELVNNRKS